MRGARPSSRPEGNDCLTPDFDPAWKGSARNVTPPSSLRRRLLAALTAAAWTLAVPFAALATPASVAFSVTPYPNNADDLGPAFVTAGELAAFDIALQNTSGSTFTSVNLTSTTSLPGTIYLGTLVTGGSAAGQVSCAPATAAAFSCTLGNLAKDATLSLRVIFRTPNLQDQLLDFTVTGKGSGASTSDPGNSRGDTFDGTGTVELVPLFLDGADERGAAEYIPSNMGAVIETAGMGTTSATNPAWTKVTVYPPGADAPIGTFGYVKEHAAGTPDFECPANFCFGQASEIQYLGGDEASTPFKVELRLDNAKASVSTPKKVTIYHVPDAGPVERPFDVTCTFVGDYPTNAPCGVSKATSSDDRTDFVFVFWLDRNGYTRGG